MPDYRRYYQPNSFVFITIVTAQRIPYFSKKENISILFTTLENVHEYYSFNLFAYAVLPDHLHYLLDLTDGNQDFSQIIHSLKRNFTLNYKKHYHLNQPISIWQKRFWDHIIRDERDLQNHLDYIHWNPVKHKVVDLPSQYEFSSFAKFVENGFYPGDWGNDNEPQNINSMDFE